MALSLAPLWMGPIYLIVHSLLIAVGRVSYGRGRILGVNLLLLISFALLLAWGYRLDRPPEGFERFLVLWTPIIFFWWAYLWARHTLKSFHPEGFSYDAAIIRLESQIGQPSLSWARHGNRLATEIFHGFYFSYFFYTLILGLYFDLTGRLTEFQAMSFAVNFGYLLSYVAFALVPVFGPRWSLVDAGLLAQSEQRQRGYFITELTNKIMFGGPAHKGGAMPSSHSATAVVFMTWGYWSWGFPFGLIAVVVGTGMWLGAIYGRYHFVVDVVVGALLGAVGVMLGLYFT